MESIRPPQTHTHTNTNKHSHATLPTASSGSKVASKSRKSASRATLSSNDLEELKSTLSNTLSALLKKNEVTQENDEKKYELCKTDIQAFSNAVSTADQHVAEYEKDFKKLEHKLEVEEESYSKQKKEFLEVQVSFNEDSKQYAASQATLTAEYKQAYNTASVLEHISRKMARIFFRNKDYTAGEQAEIKEAQAAKIKETAEQAAEAGYTGVGAHGRQSTSKEEASEASAGNLLFEILNSLHKEYSEEAADLKTELANTAAAYADIAKSFRTEQKTRKDNLHRTEKQVVALHEEVEDKKTMLANATEEMDSTKQELAEKKKECRTLLTNFNSWSNKRNTENAIIVSVQKQLETVMTEIIRSQKAGTVANNDFVKGDLEQ